MISKSTQAIVLAAGNSSRFNNGNTKQLEPICGQPMIIYVLKVLSLLNIPTILVVGKHEEKIKEAVKRFNLNNITYVRQEEQLGTGHAVNCTKSYWNRDNIFILNGDIPLITENILEKLYRKHTNQQAIISFLSSTVLDPLGYGRVIEKNNHISIVEERDCTEEQKDICLINSGLYLVNKMFLEENIDKITKSASGEYYITNLVNMSSVQGNKTQSIFIPYDYVRGVNTLEELWVVEQLKRSELIKKWMSKGVRFNFPQNTHLDYDVEIGAGTVIGAGVQLCSGTKLGERCSIGAFSVIEGSEVQDNTIIHPHSVIQNSALGKSNEVGPFARIRGNAVTDDCVVIGNFVEVKHSQISSNVKAKHLSYIGDTFIGQNSNIGAGTITCNHDGVNKHKTEIGDNAYIGSNNTLIAPIKIGNGAYTAAGSTLNKDVPADSLAIGRARQEVKPGYAKKLRKKNHKKLVNNLSKEEVEFSFLGAIKTDDFSEKIF